MKNLNEITLKHDLQREFPFRKFFGIGPEERSEFIIPFKNGIVGKCMAMNFKDEVWEHIVLYFKERCPTYEEISEVKELFWEKDEIAIQVHPPKSEYININKFALHLWRNNVVSKAVEKRFQKEILKIYEKAKEYSSIGKKEILLTETKKIVAIFGENRWPTWEEVCKVKQKYWEPEEAAIQFNISYEEDMNKEYMILLWDAKNMELPPKELV